MTASDTGIVVVSATLGWGMTSRGLLRLLLRRWYVVVVGAILTVSVLWPVTHRPGVYWTQVNAVLLPPTYEFYPNNLEDPHYSLSALAGLIVNDFNGQNRPLMTASSETTLFGLGQRTGYEVKQPNMGNQWQPLFPNASIDIQVLDSSPDIVASEAKQIVAELRTLLDERQDAIGVNPTIRVSLIASPEEPSVYYVTGSRSRALAVGTLMGIVVTFIAVYWYDRLASRRRRQSRKPGPSQEGSQRRSARVLAESRG